MIGLSPDVFWSLTPWQFHRCVEAYGTKRNYAHDDAAWMMWHGAILSRVKKIPPLKNFLSGFCEAVKEKV